LVTERMCCLMLDETGYASVPGRRMRLVRRVEG
jgi:hypothetical protein